MIILFLGSLFLYRGLMKDWLFYQTLILHLQFNILNGLCICSFSSFCPSPMLCCLFSSLFTWLTTYGRVPLCEPTYMDGPAEDFFLWKGNLSCHCCLIQAVSLWVSVNHLRTIWTVGLGIKFNETECFIIMSNACIIFTPSKPIICKLWV